MQDMNAARLAEGHEEPRAKNHSGKPERQTMNKDSLLAFLKSIRFLRGGRSRTATSVERAFAQLHPRAPQRHDGIDDSLCVRSAN